MVSDREPHAHGTSGPATVCAVPPSPPRSYLILHHIAKNRNLGALLRSADAFGVHEVVVVGRRRIASAPACGMHRCVTRVAFPRLQDAEDYLRERQVRILGVEVEPSAARLETHPFVGDTAFLVGNEGDGLTERHRAMCDAFVRIPQFGHARSLNVSTAGALALYHFALWAGYEERPIDGQKFVPKEGSVIPPAVLAARAAGAAGTPATPPARDDRG